MDKIYYAKLYSSNYKINSEISISIIKVKKNYLKKVYMERSQLYNLSLLK